MYSYEFCEIVKSTFFTERLWATASVRPGKCFDGVRFFLIHFVPIFLFFFQSFCCRMGNTGKKRNIEQFSLLDIDTKELLYS